MTAVPLRILCIEDNAMNWRLVQRLLSQAGHDLHWATDGLTGVQKALEVKPDLVLLDINLPDLSGFEVATKLRNLPDMADILIVALTAKTLPVDRDTALVTGCDGFIPKPIDPFEFVGQVEGYIQGKRDRLAQGEEQAALRQFTHQVVDHLEARFLEVQEANVKLLDIQSQLELRSGQRSRILSLMQELVFLRDPKDIVRRVLLCLREDLEVDGVVCFFQHESGAYFEGLRLRKGDPAPGDMDILLRNNPLMPCVEGCPHAHPMTGEGLAAGDCWHPGVRLGLWTSAAHAVCQPMHERGQHQAIWGLLTLHRAHAPFEAFELEAVRLHTEILQVAVENARQISRLAEHSRALGHSYADLDEVHRNLRNTQAALLESDRAVRASLRRWGASEADVPMATSLHEFLLEEIALMKARGAWPQGLDLSTDLAADQDQILVRPADLAQVLSVALRRLARQGRQGLRLSTWVEGNALLLSVTGADGGDGVCETSNPYAEDGSSLEGLLPSQGRLETLDGPEGPGFRLRLPLA